MIFTIRISFDEADWLLQYAKVLISKINQHFEIMVDFSVDEPLTPSIWGFFMTHQEIEQMVEEMRAMKIPGQFIVEYCVKSGWSIPAYWNHWLQQEFHILAPAPTNKGDIR